MARVDPAGEGRGANPFDSTLHMTRWQLTKAIIFGVVLVPIRLLLIFLLISCGVVLGQLCSKRRGSNEDYEPFSKFSRGVQWICRGLARSCLFVAGFYWVKTKGNLVDSSQAPILVIAPHSSWVDAFMFSFFGLKCVVARAESEESGVVAPIVRIFKPICVERRCKDSRLKTAEAIVRRAKSGLWPPTAIFPEGTCSNGKKLIKFKTGAFTPGVPVQPVLIKYMNKTDYISWSFKGASGLRSMLLLLAHPINYVEIEALPIYKPSDEEKLDPFLFAENVRAYMSDCLGIPVCNYTLEDGVLMEMAHGLRMPDEVGLIEVDAIKNGLGFDFNTIKTLLKQFATIDADRDGAITKDDLAMYLQVPSDTVTCDHVFSIYDLSKVGHVTFKQFLHGRHRLISDVESGSLTDATFTFLDVNDCGEVTTSQFCSVLSSETIGMTSNDAKVLFQKSCNRDSITLDKASYKSLMSTHPEYAIFINERTA